MTSITTDIIIPNIRANQIEINLHSRVSPSQSKSIVGSIIVSLVTMLAPSPRAVSWAKTLTKFVSVQVAVQAMMIASGILLVRVLTQTEYAYFTIANSMQATMS